MAELWKSVLNLMASNPIMTGFPCPKKKGIQKADESGLHAFIFLEANLDAQSCFHNGEKPF